MKKRQSKTKRPTAAKPAHRQNSAQVTWRSPAAERQPNDPAPPKIDALNLNGPTPDLAAGIQWAKGMIEYLPETVREEMKASIDAIVEEQTGWMSVLDDYWEERDKVQRLITYGIEVGFGLALARFREPLTKYSPAVADLFRRLDENRVLGTEATKAKPANDRAELKALMTQAKAEGREVTDKEIMAKLKCSRTTAWRRKTELELGQ
jgi:uncharacterized membrane protein